MAAYPTLSLSMLIEEVSLEAAFALGKALTQRKYALITAESCTGGGIAAMLTERAGSSAWFDRGIVSYSNEAKTQLLGVPPELIHAEGAVSEPVALSMARGALSGRTHRLSVAVTGIAGPSGGTALKPVGTVWFGWAWSQEGQIKDYANRHHFSGDRRAIRKQAVLFALQESRRILTEQMLCV